MRYLLDTNVVSELRKREPAPSVLRWFERVDGRDLVLSVLVVGEIEQGIARLAVRDPTAAGSIATWLGELRTRYAERLLPITDEIATVWGRLNAARPLPVVDGLLAATAIVHGLTLVTRDGGAVADTGVPLLDPFED